MNDWDAIRNFYSAHHQQIMSASPMQYGCDPYWWSDCIEMTPIERSMWSDIRGTGIVFYPQYPVLNFFVDFANPQMKIAIECDGKDWHDPKKDAIRDAKLRDIGWNVYRFTGSDCKKIGHESEDDSGRTIWNPPPGEKLLMDIRKRMENTNSVLDDHQ